MKHNTIAVVPVSHKLIIALDFTDLAAALKLVAGLTPASCRVKVGKELFTAHGPSAIRQLQQLGFEVFLDLKFHDIPHTVYQAIRIAADLGVWMVNVHVSGGREMLHQARLAINDSQHKPLLIGVTILTSLNQVQLTEIGYTRSLTAQACSLAELAYACGLDGVVCSAHEANLIKQATHAKFLTIVPGIRLLNNAADDQTRIMTPAAALANGADYLVVGRPITQATDPAAAVAEIEAQLMTRGH